MACDCKFAIKLPKPPAQGPKHLLRLRQMMRQYASLLRARPARLSRTFDVLAWSEHSISGTVRTRASGDPVDGRSTRPRSKGHGAARSRGCRERRWWERGGACGSQDGGCFWARRSTSRVWRCLEMSVASAFRHSAWHRLAGLGLGLNRHLLALVSMCQFGKSWARLGGTFLECLPAPLKPGTRPPLKVERSRA